MNENKYDPAELPDLLPIYYKRLFPYGPYYRWLHYGGGKTKLMVAFSEFLKQREATHIDIIIMIMS